MPVERDRDADRARGSREAVARYFPTVSRMDPLPLVARTRGPSSPIVPAILFFETSPRTSPPSTFTDPDRLRASGANEAALSPAMSIALELVDSVQALPGAPAIVTRPLWLVAITPPRAPRTVIALDPVCTSTPPRPVSAASTAPLEVLTRTSPSSERPENELLLVVTASAPLTPSTLTAPEL